MVTLYFIGEYVTTYRDRGSSPKKWLTLILTFQVWMGWVVHVGDLPSF